MIHASSRSTPMSKLLVDAEYFLYRAAAGSEVEINWHGDDWTYMCRHSDAKLGFQEQIALAMEAVPAAQPMLVFSDSSTFRYGVWPKYKAQRKKMRRPAGYGALIEWVSTAAASCGWNIARLPEVEGDDVLGILYEEGDVIYSMDKDMKTLPGRHLVDGQVEHISLREADLAFYTQVLTGDSADNYPGCPKYGPVTAAKLLAGCLTELEMWSKVLAAYEKAGFDQRYAITQARCARILRSGEYDHERGVPILWNPPVA